VETEVLENSTDREALVSIIARGASRSERVDLHAFRPIRDLGAIEARLNRWRDFQNITKDDRFEEKCAVRGYSVSLREQSLQRVELAKTNQIPQWAAILAELLHRFESIESDSHAPAVEKLLLPFRTGLTALTVASLNRPPEINVQPSAYAGIVHHVSHRWIELLSRCSRPKLLSGLSLYECWLETFLDNPVLGRAFSERVIMAIQSAQDVLVHLNEDVEVLCATFGITRNVCREIAHLEFGRGDCHCFGSTVAIVTLGDGTRLVHKPKDLSASVWFKELSEALTVFLPNELHLRFPNTVVVRADTTWQSYESAFPCSCQAEADSFYGRIGVLTAISQAVGARDLHGENILACGAFPVAIDLEVLAAPGPKLASPSGIATNAYETLLYSPLRPGILPELRDFDDLEAAYDGALPSRHPLAVRSGICTPKMDGKALCIEDHLESFMSGYDRGLDALIRAARTNVVSDLECKQVQYPVRFVPRTIALYDRLLAWVWAIAERPETVDMELLMERIVSETPLNHPCLIRIADEEVWALTHGDIPYFLTRPGASEVCAWGGPQILSDWQSHRGLSATIEFIRRHRETYTDIAQASIGILRVQDIAAVVPRPL